VLQHAPQFLLNNPIALQKKYKKLKDVSSAGMSKRMHKVVKSGEQTALETLVKLFDWLDGLEPQSMTKPITRNPNEESQDIYALGGAPVSTSDDLTEPQTAALPTYTGSRQPTEQE